MNKIIAPRPWYKEFWAWVVIGLPASVVIGCFFTVNIAFQNADTVVDSDWRKNGLSVEKQIEKENAAKALGLNAEVSISRQTGLISLKLQSTLKPEELGDKLTNLKILNLNLEHPTTANFDQKIKLHKTKNGLFKGKLTQFYSGLRYLNLMPLDNAWKLKGEITLFTQQAQLIK